MKILITGANGFLGKALCLQLENTQYTVLSLVRKKTNIKDIECDIGNHEHLLFILNEYQPNIIINCAAKVDFSDSSHLVQYEVNALASAIMASWCAKNNAHLLQTSGSIVNGNRITTFNNNSPEKPINYYGHTKLFADNAIRLSQCKHTVIRFGGIFGENGPAHLGINNAINYAKDSGVVPTIIGNGCSALRNYIHVQEAAKLLIYCFENKIFGLHYSGNHQSISIAQMLIDICDIYLNGKEPNYQDGNETINQIIKVSSALPLTTPFKKSLELYQCK